MSQESQVSIKVLLVARSGSLLAMGQSSNPLFYQVWNVSVNDQARDCSRNKFLNERLHIIGLSNFSFVSFICLMIQLPRLPPLLSHLHCSVLEIATMSSVGIPVTARRAKRENGGLGEDPPGSTMTYWQVLRTWMPQTPDPPYGAFSGRSSYMYMRVS